MSKAPKELRIPIMMSAAEVEDIDNWRCANRIATRAEAIRRLCQIGLFVDPGENSYAKMVAAEAVGNPPLPVELQVLSARLVGAVMLLKTGKGASIKTWLASNKSRNSWEVGRRLTTSEWLRTHSTELRTLWLSKRPLTRNPNKSAAPIIGVIATPAASAQAGSEARAAPERRSRSPTPRS